MRFILAAVATLAAWAPFNYMPTFTDWTNGYEEMRCPVDAAPPHASCQKIIIIGK